MQFITHIYSRKGDVIWAESIQHVLKLARLEYVWRVIHNSFVPEGNKHVTGMTFTQQEIARADFILKVYTVKGNVKYKVNNSGMIDIK